MRLVQIASWLVAAAALAVIVMHRLAPAAPDRGPSTPVEHPPRAPAADVRQFAPPPLSAFSAVVERPLFVASRRFEDKPLEYPPPTPEREPPRISLTAVSISSQGKVAIIKELSTGRIRRVPQGGEIDDWTVSEVLPDRIVLELGERRSSVLLFAK